MNIRKVLLLCSGLAFVMVAHAGHAATYYIAPNGSDAGSGSSSSPYKTWARALGALRAGDTLVAQDGTYTEPLYANCQSNARNGAAGAPITVRAEHERKAYIRGDGSKVVLTLNQCSYWVIEGLYLSSVDNPVNTGGGSVVSLNGGDHITLRRLLLTTPNRYFNSHGIQAIYGTHHSLFEENEIYSSARHGIMLFGHSSANVPPYNIVRRNYMHSRNHADIPGGFVSYGKSGKIKGDTGVSCYPCNNTIIENNIAEDWDAGFDIQAKTNAVNNKFLGNIALNNRYGALFASRRDISISLDSMPRDTLLVDFVSIGAGNVNDSGVGGYFRSNKNTRCDNCTFMDGTGKGFIADMQSQAPGDGGATTFGTNILSVNNSRAGFEIVNQSAATFDHLNSFHNGIADSFGSAGVTNLVRRDPALGACKVWIPESSPMKRTGAGGKDIGANILYRYQDGVLTNQPLWDRTTGAFTCGAIVPGVNDIAGKSCFDVHRRLNVNTNGCAFPPSYNPQ